MCVRFNLRLTAAELRKLFGLVDAPEIVMRYNIAPTQPIFTIKVRSGVQVSQIALWGFQLKEGQAKSQEVVNVHSDSIFDTHSFSNSIRERRCLVPASGFYEWQFIGFTKQPYHITLKNSDPLMLAGIYDATGSAALVTTEPNAEMATFFARMPVIVPRPVWHLYLDPAVTDQAEIAPLLAPLPDGSLTMQAVSQLVNNPNNECQECIRPIDSISPSSRKDLRR